MRGIRHVWNSWGEWKQPIVTISAIFVMLLPMWTILGKVVDIGRLPEQVNTLRDENNSFHARLSVEVEALVRGQATYPIGRK